MVIVSIGQFGVVVSEISDKIGITDNFGDDSAFRRSLGKRELAQGHRADGDIQEQSDGAEKKREEEARRESPSRNVVAVGVAGDPGANK